MNLFGTDGIRNKVGTYPFTPNALEQLGRAIALWAHKKHGPKPTFLLARDTRFSGSWITASLSSGLLRSPSRLYNAHVLPTPALFHLMQKDPRYTCGIMISASHNPAEDNGIKIIGRKGKITQEDEEQITHLLATMPVEEQWHEGGLELPLENAEELYTKKLLPLFKPNFLRGHKIVLDCAHGATYRVAPAIFNAFGAETITLHDAPDGYNINEHCGAVHLDSLQAAVREHQALIGFAFDGDGDRVMAVNKKGIIKDGDDSLTLLLEHPDYKQASAVVSTSMANQGFEAHVASLGKKLIRTSVGDKYVLQALTNNQLSLGGEPSGHIILKDILPTGDGILAALKMAETMLITNNLDFHSFKKYPHILINVPITTKKDLSEQPLRDIIAAGKAQIPQGRLLVRYSGTESIVRIMVEDEDSALTKTVAQSLAEQLRTVLS